jgi:hypothetical protein
MTLTDHFALGEFTVSDTAVRMGIDNTPSLEVVAHLTVVAMGLERIRSVLGQSIHISSGYRCEELERALTVKDFSAWCVRHNRNVMYAWPEYFATKAHPKGYAADFTCKAYGTPVDIVRAIKTVGIPVDQCIQEGSWVHVSFDPAMRGQYLIASFTNGTPSYTQGVV